jgi:hypothetical protein
MPAPPGLHENALARDPSSALVDTVEARAFFQKRLATATVEHALARTIELDMEARATAVGAKSQAPES